MLEVYGWSDLAPLLDDHSRREDIAQKILERLVALDAERVAEILETLVSLGQAREVEQGMFVV